MQKDLNRGFKQGMDILCLFNFVICIHDES